MRSITSRSTLGGQSAAFPFLAWVDKFGSAAALVDFRNLVSYSRYDNIQAGQRYPAILATTADTDDCVVPGHSFKYVA